MRKCMVEPVPGHRGGWIVTVTSDAAAFTFRFGRRIDAESFMAWGSEAHASVSPSGFARGSVEMPRISSSTGI